MKMLACVNLGQGQTIQRWDLEDSHLIIQRSESGAIAIPLDESKVIAVEKLDDMVKKIEGVAPSKEHYEAVRDSFDRAYPGALTIADAVLVPLVHPN